MLLLAIFFICLRPVLSSHVDQPKNTAVCIEKYCYTLFWSTKRFQGANKLCEKLGGHLMTVRSTVAADAISQMMGGGGAAAGTGSPVLWIGLQLPQGCTDPAKRLRGFQWVTGDEQSDYSNWQGNGTTCEPRCVTVLPDQSWQETDCAAKADGFLCEFTFGATCSPVTATPGQTVLYNTTFGIEGGDFLALPPGTRALIPSLGLELLCAGDGRWSREAAGAWDCEVERGGCGHTCQDSRCSCPAGQRLAADGRSCSPPPGPCEPSPCQHMCFPHGGDFLCMCHEGFELEEDGLRCRDIDDCALVPSVCEQGCSNLPGAFRCHCFQGYEEVNGKCEDTDECLEPSFYLQCEHECRNLPGGFECLCDPPYVLDPQRPGRCKLFCNTTECPAKCTQHPPSCECPDGFLIDDADSSNPICVDIDDCDSVTCDFECLNLPGAYECLCPPGQLLQADKTSCRPEGDEGSGATDEPEYSTARMPFTTAAPPVLDSFGLGILLGVIVGMLLMIFLIALIHCLLKKHYAAKRALDYKCHSTEKEVVLQKVTSDCPSNPNHADPSNITIK
ncbi:thrombomodulin [Microcaecilia unicolor]|uniref:Thrombomodulin n=1 Tax=Microcaecilia unicolor TaxID=1415580 RepID=A0A6P7XND6_9AMPH|nr:thrombomodulin [Microcaecilia unicolor]